MKNYNVINNQIDTLKQKGLKFKDEKKAKEILLKENYYYITDDYEDIFLNLKKSNKSFEEETYFEELYSIYNFDRELKNLIFDYISLVETKLKSYTAYEFIEKYGEVDLLDLKYLNSDPQTNSRLEKLKKQVNENIEKASKIDCELKEHVAKDRFLNPLMIVKHFMFGNIINYFSVLKERDKQIIAQHFNQDAFSFEKNIKMLNAVRNICAHGGVLFNFHYGFKNLFFVMKVLKNYLDKDNFYNMFIRVENLLIYVRNEIDELSYNTLLKTMGFPKDYKSIYDFKGGEKKNMNYNPKPIDTKNVVLSKEILDLAEELANNTHEIWAVGRINEGWKYGTVRDDKLKTTPCLVPYNELPESEKEYDRNTAIETLKLIQKLGFKIIKEE